MKYLFINVTAGFGSTGRIVAETCRELQEKGHECRIAYGRNENGCKDIPAYKICSPLETKVNGLLCRAFDNSGFGLKASTRKFLAWVRDYDPDVIWLHNVHGYYLHVGLLFNYLRKSGKEIIWMLHDCWTFTGHCAYFDYVQCDRWKTGCHDCPDKKQYPASLLLDRSRQNYLRKKELFTGIPNLRLIVPSHWLETRVKQSFLKDYPVEVIYNKADKNIFKPTPSDFRQQHHLEDKILLLGVASVWDRRKGLEDFLALSPMLDDRYKIVLVGLNEKQRENLPSNILGLGRTRNAQELAEIYSAADYYLNPGVEETFGMTVLEAQCCGTTSIVYEGSACAEVAAQFGGIIVKRGPAHLYEAVKNGSPEETK